MPRQAAKEEASSLAVLVPLTPIYHECFDRLGIRLHFSLIAG